MVKMTSVTYTALELYLERQFQSETRKDGKLINTLILDTIKIEDVIPVVDVGHTRRCFEFAVFP